MKKLTVYNVYLDDGKSAFRVTIITRTLAACGLDC